MNRFDCNREERGRLYRDTERGVILGVCAGLADAGGVPPWLARLVALIALCWFTQATIVAYVVAALLLPERPLRYNGLGDEASFWRSGRGRTEP